MLLNISVLGGLRVTHEGPKELTEKEKRALQSSRVEGLGRK